MDEWTCDLNEIKAKFKALVAENEALKKENRELRADRDYYRQLMDQTGGKG